MGKGGARRKSVPGTDLDHLFDVIKECHRSGCLHFRSYENVSKAQAILGKDMVGLLPLLKALMGVQPSLMFKYMDLKEVYKRLNSQFPELKSQYPVQDQHHLSSKMADCTMTVCTHARRLKDDNRFKEACRSLSDWQVERLQQVRDMLAEGELDEKGGGSKEKAKVPMPVESDAASVDTLEALELEVPATQDTLSEAEDSHLKRAAEKAVPVPSRKQGIKRSIEKSKKASLKPLPKTYP